MEKTIIDILSESIKGRYFQSRKDPLQIIEPLGIFPEDSKNGLYIICDVPLYNRNREIYLNNPEEYAKFYVEITKDDVMKYINHKRNGEIEKIISESIQKI